MHLVAALYFPNYLQLGHIQFLELEIKSLKKG